MPLINLIQEQRLAQKRNEGQARSFFLVFVGSAVAAVGGFGLATVIFALSSMLWLSLLALFALGACDMVSVVIRSALVQLETPDAMRGRVSAVNAIFVNTSNQLGEFESGLLAAWMGAPHAALLGGLGTLLVVGLWMQLFPTLRRRQRLQSEPVTGA
jgi:MFS family permease